MAFAQAAAQDGIQLGGRSFDWLCEQGHVGLERVAKARRDATLIRPVTAALELLAKIYVRLKGDVSVLYASRENLLLPVDLVHTPTGTVIEVDGPPHFNSSRLAALELYPPAVAVGSTSTSTGSCAAPGARGPTASGAAWPPRALASAEGSGNGRTTMRCVILRRRRWATHRWCGSPPWTAMALPPTAATGPGWWRCWAPDRLTRRRRHSLSVWALAARR